jgi:hypothetical protein
MNVWFVLDLDLNFLQELYIDPLDLDSNFMDLSI